MTQIFNTSENKQLRQKLRNESPKAEVRLWNKLRGRQVLGLKFHRQYSIERFVVDFYCPKIKLVIEVDGDTHYRPEAIVNDHIRSDEFKRLGLSIIRFDNNDIYNNLSGVLDRVYEAVNALNPS